MYLIDFNYQNKTPTQVVSLFNQRFLKEGCKNINSQRLDI